MATRAGGPDALIVGAPKAGTTALHAALAAHPEIFASPVKEPKFYLCGEAPPPAYRGPGDAHSQREWVWRRADYERLFAAAPADAVRLESTPFYLYSEDARRRIADELPDVKLIAIVRDPIDRAYSNWMHLWVDGLEPEPDFVAACAAESARIENGWAPFWHYRRMGRYGAQLADLFERVDRDRVLVFRYRELVSDPGRTLQRVCRFLGIAEDRISTVPPDNSRGYVSDGLRNVLLGRAIRFGALLGSTVDPRVWRRASRPLLAARRAGGPPHRPPLDPDQRRELLDVCLDDIGLLEEVLGESFADWRSVTGRGSFAQRRTT